MAAPATMEDVSTCVSPFPKDMHVNVARASTASVSLVVLACLTALLQKTLALMEASVSAAARSVTDMWTVQTSRMNRAVSFHHHLKNF